MKRIVLHTTVAVLSFLYGTVSVTHRLFPYPQISAAKLSMMSNPPDLADYPYWRERVSFFVNSESKAKNVMIGDSLTDHAEWGELFPGASIVNRGINSDTTHGVLKRIKRITRAEPANAFIMIGINDVVKNRPTETILKDYIEIISSLRSDRATPIIQSTLYVGKGYRNREHINSEIRKINSALLKYSRENGITFIDLNNALSENGVMKAELTEDGVHLNADGYRIWKETISQYIAR